MHTLLLKTKTAADAKLLAEFLSKMKTVESVTIDPPEYDEIKWSNTMRALSDKEHEKLIKESEESVSMVAEDAEAYSAGLIKKWSGKKK
jgi:hypothetical protein